MLIRTLSKLWKNFLYSLAGLKATFQRELAFRLEVIALLFFTPFLFIITELSNTQKALMFATLVAPMAIELLNSAVEAICDMLTTEYHVEVKFIKDAASAAVLLSVIVMIVTWGLCLWNVLY